MHDVTMSIELMGRDWLQQLCLVNIDDCTKHKKHLISRLFYFTVAFSALTLLVGHCCMAGAQQQHGAQHAAKCTYLQLSYK